MITLIRQIAHDVWLWAVLVEYSEQSADRVEMSSVPGPQTLVPDIHVPDVLCAGIVIGIGLLQLGGDINGGI